MEQILTLGELAIDVERISPNVTKEGVKDKFLELWFRGEREIFKELDTTGPERAHEVWLSDEYHLKDRVEEGLESPQITYDQNRYTFMDRLRTYGYLPDDRDWTLFFLQCAADASRARTVNVDEAPRNPMRKLKTLDDLGAEIAQQLIDGNLSIKRFELIDRLNMTGTVALRFLLFAGYKIPVKLKRFLTDTATIRAPRGRRSGSAVNKDACCRYLEKLIVDGLYEPRAGGVPAAASMIKLIFDPPLTEVTIEANIRDAHAEWVQFIEWKNNKT